MRCVSSACCAWLISCTPCVSKGLRAAHVNANVKHVCNGHSTQTYLFKFTFGLASNTAPHNCIESGRRCIASRQVVDTFFREHANVKARRGLDKARRAQHNMRLYMRFKNTIRTFYALTRACRIWVHKYVPSHIAHVRRLLRAFPKEPVRLSKIVSRSISELR